MPKNTWEQSKARRLWLQGVMTFIFGATLGLAAWVDRARIASARTELGDAVVEGGVSVRLPRGWAVAHETNSESGRFLLAVEKGRGGRTIGVYRHRPDQLLSPLEYVARSGVMSSARPQLRGEFPGAVVVPEPTGGWSATSVSGFPGVLWRVSYPLVKTQYDLPELQTMVARMLPKQLVVATVLPSRQAVAVRLAGMGPLEPADDQLVRDVAGSLSLLDEKPVPADDPADAVIDLRPAGATEAGVVLARVRVPSGFGAPPVRGGLWTTRVLVGTGPASTAPGAGQERAWEAIELTPATLPADVDAKWPAMLLAIGDPAWAGATVTDESNVGDGLRVWRVEPAGSDLDFAVARRGYVVAEPDGRALVVVLHLPRAAAARLDPLWHALLPTIRFPGAGEVELLRKNGTAAAGAFQPPQAWTNQSRWWLRTGAGEERGWASDTIDSTGRTGISAGRALAWTGRVNTVQTMWSLGKGTYNAARSMTELDVLSKPPDATEVDPGTAPEARRVEQRSLQQVILDNGRLVTSLKGPMTVRTSMPVPDDFVPAPLLPALLARASGFPLTIQTDARPGREHDAAPGLVRLNVRPDARSPGGPPSLLVELDGGGEAQRWTFDDRTHALSEIEFADGSKLVPGTEADVKFLSAKDQRMAP